MNDYFVICEGCIFIVAIKCLLLSYDKYYRKYLLFMVLAYCALSNILGCVHVCLHVYVFVYAR